MCGIAGIINFNSSEEKEPLLRHMISILRHRGPDAAGIYTDDIAGLAHARLSIIDLVGGNQPIHNEDKTLWIIYNGEVSIILNSETALLKTGILSTQIVCDNYINRPPAPLPKTFEVDLLIDRRS